MVADAKLFSHYTVYVGAAKLTFCTVCMLEANTKSKVKMHVFSSYLKDSCPTQIKVE